MRIGEGARKNVPALGERSFVGRIFFGETSSFALTRALLDLFPCDQRRLVLLFYCLFRNKSRSAYLYIMGIAAFLGSSIVILLIFKGTLFYASWRRYYGSAENTDKIQYCPKILVRFRGEKT